MGQQGIDQRAVLVARGRVDDQAGRLVEHDQVAVLEQDGQRDVLRQGDRGDRGGDARCGRCCRGGSPPTASRIGAPSRLTAPSMISALTRERESEPIASARKRSARMPAWSGGGGDGEGFGGRRKGMVGGCAQGPGRCDGGADRRRHRGAGGVARPARRWRRRGGGLAVGRWSSRRGRGSAAWRRRRAASAVLVQRPDGDRVLVVDPKRGRVVGEIRLGRVMAAPQAGTCRRRICAACGRPFAWRRKWARDWEQVRYCSDACREGRYPAARKAIGKAPKGA